MPTLQGIQHVSIQPSLPGCVLFIYQKKIEGPKPPETDTKMSIPAPTFYLQAKKM